MALFGLDFSGIFNAVKGFLGPLGKLIDKVKESYDKLTGVLQSAETLKDSIVEEINGWKSFKQDIRLAQRVIQIERAIQKTRDLIEGIPAAWRSIVEIVKTFRAQIGGESNPVEDTEAIVEDVESSGGISALLRKFPALAKGLEKLLGVLGLIVQALDAIATTISDLQQIVDELKALRLEFEKLDTIFLSQSNKRKTLRLEDGSRIRVRIGKLHPS